ncbi:MAG TPA: acyl-CoA dehydrogenase family protein [Pseudogracilibacillus sp.]|nr:acyl-CoA dehydrogenase family protein [Pseudogracilibacillus sp.]
MSQTTSNVVEGASFLVDEQTAENLITPEDVTDMHKMMEKTTKDFVAEKVVPKLDQLERHEYENAISLFAQAGELGLLSMDVPEEYGGMELDQLSSALITENFSRAEGFAVAHNIHVGVGTLPITYFGNQAQKEKYLPAIASGEHIAAYALTEPGSGSDALAAKATAIESEDGTHYILNGEKQWITNASIASVFIVFAQVNKQDFTAFIVERDWEGVSTGPEEDKLGIHSCSTATLNLEDVKVPKENIIWEIGKGHLVALNILNIARYKLALMSVGQAKRAIELGAAYANERHQFQQPIASFGMIQEKIANMNVSLFAAESAVYRTSGLLDDVIESVYQQEETTVDIMGQSLGEYQLECAVNKFSASEMLDKVVDEALQIHGGYGYMSEYEITNLYRDARIDRIFEGTNEINRLTVGRTLINKMRKSKHFSEKILAQEINGKNIAAALQKEDSLHEMNVLQTAKQLFRMLLQTIWNQYDKQLIEEQEVIALFADMVSEIYTMESVIYRSKKHPDFQKDNEKPLLLEVYCYESIERILGYSKQLLNRVPDTTVLETIQTVYSQLPMIDIIDKKRQIAQQVSKKAAYTVV